MKKTKQDSSSANPENRNTDWMTVLFEVLLKILTLGFYHIQKHRKN
jgi:hypothetical protein